MLNTKATQALHNHVIEELHRLYRNIDSSSKISYKKNYSIKKYCTGVHRKACLVLAGV
jgi:hypothetical protein